jgi:hypothetical protein
MAGTNFEATQAVFYRPVASLSFALDDALWGPNPVGYHLTNAVLQVAVALAAFAAYRQLRLSRGAALLGAGLLAFHPTMATSVPVIARRYDPLSAVFLFGSVALTCRGGGGWSRIAAVVLFGGSLLAKESAFGALPLLPLVLFAAWFVRGDRAYRRWGAYVSALLPFAVVAAAAFVVRYAVLGALGGHRDVDIFSPNFEEYRVMLDRYIFFLFWPFRHLYPERTVGWAALIVAVVVALGGLLRLVEARTRVLVGVGLAWAAGFGLFFIVLRHINGPWYLYYPLLGLGLAVGAALDGLLKSRRAGVLAACGGVYTLGSLVGSPLVRPYDQWHQAGAIMHQYLAGIAACSEGLPDGTAITLWNAPRLFDDGTDESFLILPSMIEGFTYDAYMHLIHPERQFNLFIGQPVTYTSNPPDLLVTCGWGGNNRRRVVATSTSLPLPDFPTD